MRNDETSICTNLKTFGSLNNDQTWQKSYSLILHGMLVVWHWWENEDNEWSAFRMYPKITYWLYVFVRGRWFGIRSSCSLTYTVFLTYQVPKPLCSINGIFTAFSSSQVAWSQRASNSQSQIVRASMRRKLISAPQHRCATESSRGLELRQIEMITMPRATSQEQYRQLPPLLPALYPALCPRNNTSEWKWDLSRSDSHSRKC